ncbi:unnamed protein product [Trichobilharzia regenti]|nr:unnamed protein product [Trichobilharzia regenti]
MTTNWSNSTQSKQFQRLGNRRRCCSTGLSESTLITNIPNISLKPIMDITNPLQTTSSSVNKYNDSNYILLAATNSSNIQSNFNNTSTTHNLLDGGINSYITLSNTERNPVLYPSSRLRLGEIF